MLDSILNARSVAVIGASKNATKRGFQAIRTLINEGYDGRIFPVNPKESTVLGLQCYPSVEEIPEPVDLALITTPARTIPKILEDCGQKKIAGAVIIAGGFRELGESGTALEAEMVATAQKAGVRIVGPNTSGMINVKSGLNLVGLGDIPKGGIALLCQSGNMALTLITEAVLGRHQGFTYYVGVGNESDIKFHEYLAFFENDPDTRAILMYVEGMSQGRAFLQQAYQTTRKKPVILLKSGRSVSGKRSAGSHTGSLAGMSEVARAAYKRVGVVVIDNSDELFPVADALSSQPPIRNNRVAILADGGGHATIAADLLSDYGIELPELADTTRKKLAAILPAAASTVNPVDVAGATDADPSLFADCARILVSDPGVGGLLIVGLFGGYGIRFSETLTFLEEQAAHRIGRMVQKGNKPILVHSLYASYNSHPLEILHHYDIPVNASLDISCKCLAALCRYGSYLDTYHGKTVVEFDWVDRSRKAGRRIVENALAEGRTALLEHEAKKLLRLHGAPTSDDQVALTEDQAVEFFTAIDGPVVMKIVSPDILHKSDAGGVMVGIQSPEMVRSAFREIMNNARVFCPEADIRGILVAPMAAMGLEVIIGTKTDDQFGPVIMYGLGGVMVEILKDVTFRVLPLTPSEASRMIGDTRSSIMLDGIRGQKPYDKKALRRLLLICSELIGSYPEILEMDLNPVILHHEGLDVVDARILLRD